MLHIYLVIDTVQRLYIKDGIHPVVSLFFLVVVVVVGGNSSDKGFCMLILYTALFSILLFM